MKKIFPVSFNQLSMYLEQQLNRNSYLNNAPFAFRIKYKIDVESLKETFDCIIQRHELLRVTFKENEHGEVFQHIMPEPLPYFKYHNVKNNNEKELKELIKNNANEPFDLQHAAVFRVDVFEINHKHFILLWNGHHSVIDMWSHSIIFKDFYQMYIQNKSHMQLRKPKARYSDFTREQIESVRKKNNDAELYWLNKLSGKLAVYSFPNDRKHDPKIVSSGSIVTFNISQEISDNIMSLAKELGVTPYTFCFAAYQVLLSFYSSQDEVIIGTAMAGRTSHAYRTVVGNFVNTVAIRQQINVTQSFKDFVKKTNKELLLAKQYQHYPFSKLVEKLLPKRSHKHPVYQCFFNWSKPPKSKYISTPSFVVGAKDSSNSSLEPFLIRQEMSQFEMSMYLSDTPIGFVGGLLFNAQVLDNKSAQSFAGSYESLLNSIAQNPDILLKHLNFINNKTDEKLITFNKIDETYNIETSIPKMFSQSVKNFPNDTALIFEGQSLSYEDLDKKSNQLSRFLLKNRVAEGMPVAVSMERSLDAVCALLAVIKIGAFYIPIDPKLPINRIQFLTSDSQAAAILTYKEFKHKFHEVKSLSIFALDEFSTLNSINKISTEPLTFFPKPSDNAYAIYTSGSTGEPKAAVIRHRSLVNRLLWMQEHYQLDPDKDRFLQKTPYSFDVSLWEIFWPLTIGATLVIAKPEGHKDADYLIDLVTSNKITTLHFVPSMLSIFLMNARCHSCAPQLKRVFCSGEELSVHESNKFFSIFSGVDLHNHYGPTEATIEVTYWPCKPGESDIPIGFPAKNSPIYILDKHMRKLPIGVIGEIHLGGVQVAKEYINRPILTKNKFINNPFNEGGRLYKTGDLGQFRADGAILYKGRIDSQIKIRGFRIEPGEIENIIHKLFPINEVVVLMQTVAGEKKLVAYISQNANSVNKASHYITILGQNLPEYMVPSHIVFIENMPLNHNGKIDRNRLPKFELSISVDKTAEPKTSSHRRLVKIWKNLLVLGTINIDTNYFDLGASSLMLAKARAAINIEFNSNLSMVDFFQHTTIRKLADKINGFNKESEPNLLGGRKRTRRRRQIKIKIK